MMSSGLNVAGTYTGGGAGQWAGTGAATGFFGGWSRHDGHGDGMGLSRESGSQFLTGGVFSGQAQSSLGESSSTLSAGIGAIGSVISHASANTASMVPITVRIPDHAMIPNGSAPFVPGVPVFSFPNYNPKAIANGASDKPLDDQRNFWSKKLTTFLTSKKWKIPLYDTSATIVLSIAQLNLMFRVIWKEPAANTAANELRAFFERPVAPASAPAPAPAPAPASTGSQKKTMKSGAAGSTSEVPTPDTSSAPAPAPPSAPAPKPAVAADPNMLLPVGDFIRFLGFVTSVDVEHMSVVAEGDCQINNFWQDTVLDQLSTAPRAAWALPVHVPRNRDLVGFAIRNVSVTKKSGGTATLVQCIPVFQRVGTKMWYLCDGSMKDAVDTKSVFRVGIVKDILIETQLFGIQDPCIQIRGVIPHVLIGISDTEDGEISTATGFYVVHAAHGHVATTNKNVSLYVSQKPASGSGYVIYHR